MRTQVAVIGAGPAGLSVARELAVKGYQVTVYDIMYFGSDFLPKSNPALKVVDGDIRDTGKLAEAIQRDFGSLERWRAEFAAMGKAEGGGSGWVVLTRSARDGTLSNVWSADHTHALSGGTPLLALDMYEHAYHLDFGADAGRYVDTVMRNLHWGRISQRFEAEIGVGKGRATVWTCDLTKAYVEINGDYRS